MVKFSFVEDGTVEAVPEKQTGKVKAFIDKIVEQTGITPTELKKMVDAKKKELKGLISEEGALFIIAKELGVDLSKKKDPFGELIETPKQVIEVAEEEAPKEIIENVEIVEAPIQEKPAQVENHAIVPFKADLPALPPKEEVDAYLDMYNYVKKKIVDDSDFNNIQGKKFMKKSGWRKFIKAFNLSIELIEKNVFNLDDDTHAEVRVRASLPSGQAVEGYAIKSKSEYYSERYKNYGNYNLHNLISTAYTRAVNRAISDLVGFGEVSAEEVIQREDKELF